MSKRVVIIGAAGRDFHNFNTVYRDNEEFCVVAFTAAQIPNITERRYPAALAGHLYPNGIPIFPESELSTLIRENNIDDCVFAYSDVSYQHVMTISATVHAAGANFILLGPHQTQLVTQKPVISIGAVRTGCGKSQTSRKIIEYLMSKKIRVVAIRHPMPYGDLAAQKVQRFASMKDIDTQHCTVEEREEYEPHVVRGNVVYAGVDYKAIAEAAQKDPNGCDVLVWDGGNNDFPFYKPTLHITVTDPHRPGHELTYYPGSATLKMADVAIINKVDSADAKDVETVRQNIIRLNPDALIIDCASMVEMTDPNFVKGKKVLVIEDGPTLTHGQMKIGAGVIAAQKFGASEIVDPRPFAVGRILDTFKDYPEIGAVLPAMGYGADQLKDLEATINTTTCDAVVIGTPIDLARIIKISKPSVRVSYRLQEKDGAKLTDVLECFIKKHLPASE